MNAWDREPSGVNLTVDGVVLPAEQCVWLEFAPCGCLSGAMTVRESFTQAQAEKEFFESSDPAWVKRALEQGFRLVLATYDTYRATPTERCTHDPIWGVPPRPTPEGFTWKVEGDLFAKKTARLHLFDSLNQSICGRHQDRYGKFGDRGTGGHLECGECWKKAEALTTDGLPAAEGVLL